MRTTPLEPKKEKNHHIRLLPSRRSLGKGPDQGPLVPTQLVFVTMRPVARLLFTVETCVVMEITKGEREPKTLQSAVRLDGELT